jgi:hypothetical protein
VTKVSGEVNALPYREVENSSRVVHIATILGKTSEYGFQKGEPDFWLETARWNVEQKHWKLSEMFTGQNSSPLLP